MLESNQLTFHYSDQSVGIKNIDFSTKNGSIIGIIGANGAGKSTFFKCLLGLLKPQSGELRHFGEIVHYNKKNLKTLRQSVNLVLQDPERQIFYSDVYDDVAMGPRNLNLSDDKVHEVTMKCIKQVDAESFMTKPVQYLSFGQKKRVSIAGILAISCDVILLDEPETGLDPQMRREMLSLIKALSLEGKKIILSSHNMDMIYEVCDYIYLMHQGEFIDHGPVDVIMTDVDKLKASHLEPPLMVKMAKSLNLNTQEIRKLFTNI